ncbi:selenocysteine-specific translation elongation factor [Massilia sp. CFBP9012]|uniref:selenocysteine-specific translation elongation factor n=1 Tax=Massilia sp. CFBP9012 TaxID=3096531 RepID=UPI002A6A0B94|nr:selenocysteine-specific translation elongation factor [Massilia sp. CFBP9012]MDY0975652.1 selenocysteine-specific translation elongation factor [Massilia sp. CFBP9012]
MIVGTAGHIDHGKTALVRALTGIDADRLPEEKKRGITIELGYAWMPLEDGGRIGFVDVPGHEKLVRTMVAGASGIDFGLLLIAADDGPMPQTIEHATILSLLGVRRGAAVITKIDRVDAERLRATEAAVAGLLASAGLEDYPVLQVSSIRGDGIDALRALLVDALHTAPGDGVPGAGFRMGLDRAFTLDGVGTVVAGSVSAGKVAIGDGLSLATTPDKQYRVRSLQVHSRAAQEAHAGQRCAVGLAGLERSDELRGQVLCDPAIALTTQRIDVWLQVAATEERALRSGTLVHLHAATQDCLATVAVLGQPSIAPGGAAPAQLVLHKPANVWHGDRFILRDASAIRTVAGGAVLDPLGLARYRQTPERLAYLETQRADDPMTRLLGALVQAPYGVNGATWLRSSGLAARPFDLASVPDIVVGGGGEWIVSRARLQENEAGLLRVLGDFHAKYPDEIGPDLLRARRLAAPRMPEALWLQLTEHMIAAGSINRRNGFLHLPEHGVALRAAEQVVAEHALPKLLDGRFDPPWVRDIAQTARLPEVQVRQVLGRMARGGDVYQIVKDLFYHPAVMQEAADLVRRLAHEDAQGQVTAARFRDETGLGRKRAIQILEFFDRIGFLRRVGDVHLLRPGTLLFPPKD